MANKQHLAVLKQGVEAWNLWRQEHAEIAIDLSNVNLSGERSNRVLDTEEAREFSIAGEHFYLVGINFSGADLRGTIFGSEKPGRVDLSNANFIGANLEKAYLRKVRLAEADFSKAKLREADLSSANLLASNFNGADLCLANISGTGLRSTSFRYANLNEQDFSNRDLKGLDFTGAILTDVNFSNSDLNEIIFTGANLSRTRLEGANLSNVNFKSADLSYSNLSGQDLNKFDLEGVRFSEANLSNVELIETNLCEAILYGANLKQSKLLGADLRRAVLTGACLEDWSYNSATNLEGIICDFIYLKQVKQERRPSNINTIFKPGEFTKLFQKAQETVDLIFLNGIDWAALLTSLKQLNIKYEDADIFVQGIENKGDGSFIVRVSVPSKADKGAIEAFVKHRYELQLKMQEERLALQGEQLDFFRDQVEIKRQENTKLLGAIETMVEKESTRIINMNSGNYIESNSGTYVQGDYISMSQDLTHAAAQIQDLLEQLQKQGKSVATAQEQVARDIATQAQSNPTVKNKLVKWGQSLGDATVTDVIKGVVKLALRSAGVPLP